MQAEKKSKEKEKTTESKHMTQACWTQYEIIKILPRQLSKNFIFTCCVDNFLPQTLKMSAQLIENFLSDFTPYPGMSFSDSSLSWTAKN